MFDCVVDPLDMRRLRLNDAYLWKKGASPVTVLSVPRDSDGRAARPDFEVSHDFLSGSGYSG